MGEKQMRRAFGRVLRAGALASVSLLSLCCVFACLFGTSTETENADSGTCTETENCIQIVRVEIRPGQDMKTPLDQIAVLGEDSTSVSFDTSISAFMVADIAGSDTTSQLYAMDSEGLVSSPTFSEPEGAPLTNVRIYIVDLIALIVDTQRRPVSNMKVSVRNAEAMPGVWSENDIAFVTSSDSSGYITIQDLAEGEYVLAGRSSGDNQLRFFDKFKFKDSLKQYREIAFQETRRFTGALSRQSGLPVDSTRIFLKGTDLDAYADGSGRFDFGEIPAEVPGIGFEINTLKVDVDTGLSPNTLADSVKAGICQLKDYSDEGAIELEYAEGSPYPGEQSFIILDVDLSSCRE
ncbi:hypothetical protein ACFL5V_01355 [Fibrobacterota bacterium]